MRRSAVLSSPWVATALGRSCWVAVSTCVLGCAAAPEGNAPDGASGSVANGGAPASDSSGGTTTGASSGGFDAQGGAGGNSGPAPSQGGTSTGGFSSGASAGGGSGTGGAPGAGGGSSGVPAGGTGNGGSAQGGNTGTDGGSAQGGNTAIGGSSDGLGGMSPSGGSDAGSAGSAGSAPKPPFPPAFPLVNGVQWADTEGNPIQAHGGGILEVDGYYYWFGENRNPDNSFRAVSAYRSRDLMRWEYVNDVLHQNSGPGLSPANVERPKVIYNASTKKYVLWAHWENGKDYGEARAAVASSDTVAGDYTYHGSFRPLADSGVMDHGKPGYMSRDCTLFVDDDGKGYFLSASNENYDLNLYELTPDYLGIARLAAVLFAGGHREAPALFKRNGVYFLLTSGATGWSPNQAKYATSRSLTSGWSSMQNVADGNTFYSQPTFVLPIQGSEGTSYLYLGDRWAGAWSGRVNDSAYVWQPITFPSATSMSMSWNNQLVIDATAGTIDATTTGFRFINVKSGKALDVAGGSTQNNADIVQSPESDSESQIWRLNYDGSGYFRITNSKSGKILDVPDESIADGVELIQYDNHDGDNQVWRLVDLGDGELKLRNKKSNKVAAVVQGSTADAAPVEQRTEGDGPEQRWKLVPVP